MAIDDLQVLEGELLAHMCEKVGIEYEKVLDQYLLSTDGLDFYDRGFYFINAYTNVFNTIVNIQRGNNEHKEEN